MSEKRKCTYYRKKGIVTMNALSGVKTKVFCEAEIIHIACPENTDTNCNIIEPVEEDLVIPLPRA